MSTEHTPKSDKDLWQSLTMDQAVASAPVSDLDFAAWLDGRLSETQASHIEAAVSAHPELRRAALELSDILGKPLPAPPPRMTVRAQALVGFEVETRISRGSWWAGLLPAFGQGFALQRGALAGMTAAVAVVGFMLGGGLGEAYSTQKYASAQPAGVTLSKPLGRDTTNELADLFADPT